jgi:hypothetical protein
MHYGNLQVEFFHPRQKWRYLLRGYRLRHGKPPSLKNYLLRKVDAAVSAYLNLSFFTMKSKAKKNLGGSCRNKGLFCRTLSHCSNSTQRPAENFLDRFFCPHIINGMYRCLPCTAAL